MMIKKRYLMFLSFAIVSVLIGSLFVNNLILAQTGGEYDPWLDYNEDGTIDVNDLNPLGQAYGSSGDPTKKVEVTNWPISREVIVWYSEPIGGGTTLFSPDYNASGFSSLHLQIVAGRLSGSDTVRVEVVTHTVNLRAYTYVLSETDNFRGVTVPVPSELFYFLVEASTPSSPTAVLELRFYLTWA